MIDVVIVSDGKTDFTRRENKTVDFSQVTQKAIDTARLDEGVNVIVVEAQKDIVYERATTIYYEFPFNYNKCLNYGASKGNQPYIAFCNNDLEFTKGWTGLIPLMQQYRAVSGSPADPDTCNEYRIRLNGKVWTGTQVRRLFCGWCFVWKRDIWQKYPHDERRVFWTADNASAYTIEKRGLKHIFSTKHIVYHRQNLTLNTKNAKERERLEWDEAAKFNRDYPGKAIFTQQLKKMGKS